MEHSHIYRAGIIGTGPRGMALYEDVSQSNRMSVVAAADACGTNFEKLNLGDALYQEFEEMLQQESIDVAIIATPITTHYEIARRVLNFPITGLYLEKSMSTRLWEADNLVQRAKEREVYFVVGHQLRYSPKWASVKKLLDDGFVGELQYIRAHRAAALLTHHTHQTDLMRYYLDDSPVSWVLGQIGRSESFRSEGMESETQGLGFVQFENGVAGVIESGEYQPSAGNHLMLIGENGEIRVGSDSRCRSNKTAGNWMPLPEYEQPNLFDDLCGWIEGGPEHRSCGRNGRDTLEVILAIYESSRSRSRVLLPLEHRGNALEEMMIDGTLP